VREREAPSVAKQSRTSTSMMILPRAGVTVDALVELYSEIADWVLPHVKDRPLTLVKATQPITREDALRTQAGFVHHTARDQRFVPDTVPRIKIAEKKKTGEYCYVDSRAALLAMVGAGVIEWHAWNAKVAQVERPDRVVFDIDPGEDVSWRDVVAAARRLRRILERRELESWVKTTGGKGLHVVVPFRAEHDWETVFEFSREIATLMTEDDPRYILAFDRSRRKGKLLIDYKRNYRTSIAVAGFSTRATPMGSMSVPVKWEELGRIKRSDAWNVGNIRERLRRLSADPWEGYWSQRQRLRP
jgi:bifunctional non-homologous end joining protein LigD